MMKRGRYLSWPATFSEKVYHKEPQTRVHSESKCFCWHVTVAPRRWKAIQNLTASICQASSNRGSEQRDLNGYHLVDTTQRHFADKPLARVKDFDSQTQRSRWKFDAVCRPHTQLRLRHLDSCHDVPWRWRQATAATRRWDQQRPALACLWLD